jgi:polyhydroxyalkanoate synthesis regulator phasin
MNLKIRGKIRTEVIILKLKAIAVAAAIAMSLNLTVSFAEPAKDKPRDGDPKDRIEQKFNERDNLKQKQNESQDFERNPIKKYEQKKLKIKKLLEEGKITKEKADRILERIDGKIKEIEEFQNLPLEKKREKIIRDFKEKLDNMVSQGKMKKEEAEKMMKEIIEKINAWDGRGFPEIHIQ